jgi:putative ABC transport system substrate-binding protein
MRRREFITLLAGVTAGCPLVVPAQQVDRARRIGVLMGYPESDREGTGQFGGVPRGTPEARVDGGPRHPDRHSLVRK